MRAHIRNYLPGLLAAASIMVLVSARPAAALTPVVVRVVEVSPLSSSAVKVARAECPWYQRVLGGEALISGAGAAGKVAIQGAFPMYDAGLLKWVFVVKASEEDGYAGSWSVTAVAYCTTSPEAPIYVQASSVFDSDPVKSVEVECPFPLKVVGMGGEVTKLDGDPLADTASIPSTDLIFHGMETNTDMRKVKASGIESGGLLGGDFDGNWKVTAVAACAREAYYEGLEVRIARASEGGDALSPDDSSVMVACSPGKKNIAVGGSMVGDQDMGTWFLHRFSRKGAGDTEVYGKVYRNSSTAFVKHTVSTICVNN